MAHDETAIQHKPKYIPIDGGDQPRDSSIGSANTELTTPFPFRSVKLLPSNTHKAESL